MRSSIFKFVLFFGFLCLLGFTAKAFAEQQEPNDQEDLYEMSLEELMEVEVVSASRQA